MHFINCKKRFKMIYFKDNFDYQPYVCNKNHDFSMTMMDLSDFFILTLKIMITECILAILIKKKL